MVERFDRVKEKTAWLRKAIISSLTLQGLDENGAHYASYPATAEILRHRARDPAGDMAELWSRMCFIILVGNIDDHARNHACFWDGETISLTPAYDIDPRPRLGREANKAMAVNGEDRRGLLASALAAAGNFGLRQENAISIAARQIQTIQASFRTVAAEAGLTRVEHDRLAGRAFLNPYVFEGAPEEIAQLDPPSKNPESPLRER